MNPLLEQFLAENRDCLQSIGEKLLALEREPGSTDLLNELFRLVHTLKGNSGLFDFPEMTRVLHAGEDLMDAVRNGQVQYSDDLADELLNMVDFVTLLNDEIEQHGQLSGAHVAQAAELVKALRAMLAEQGDASDAQADAQAGLAAAATPRGLADVPVALRQQWAQEHSPEQPHIWLQYEPEPSCFFKGEDPFFQFRQVPRVQWCGIEALQPWSSPQELDPYTSNLRFMAVSNAPLDELAALFRYVPEQITIQALTPAMLLDIPSAAQASRVSSVNAEHLCRILDAQIGVLSLDDKPSWAAGRLEAVANTLRSCCVVEELSDALPALELALAESLQSSTPGPLKGWCLDVRAGVVGLASEPPAQQQEPSAAPGQGAAPNPAASGSAHQATPAQGAASAPSAAASRKSDEPAGAVKTLKVDQVKVDRLMGLIGEIVVAKNSLPYLASRAENHYGSREMAREIKAQYAVINRIAEEMQDAIMQVRMMPVSFVLQRFPRLVRDISKKLHKEVELIIEGEETEIDKNIVEALGDPLIHIVRNSLDHGLELPEQRIKAGKSATGTLRIRASQESDRVIIDITDDGKGIDPTIIKTKAYEKGLIDEATLERISDQEAVNLIFAAGFSTSETISDLSGRGVGMDVVRNAIEKVNGTVSLQSQVGKGTQLRLSLPLSMAVTNVMLIQSSGQLFGVPMDCVVETVRLPKAEIHGIKQARTTVLRGQVIPLLSLNELLALNTQPQLNDEGEHAVLVLRHDGEHVGVLVDDFQETIDIILKPMTGILASLGVYSGSALLGDGSVLMVLNPRELIQ
ncbi:chemotaxis protein CheW [Limnobacter sp.]|uniref:chemotaxis protein CheA n=1 Tax=Limnobacter sp. TaxID=2003368 RepID=UPI003514EEFB